MECDRQRVSGDTGSDAVMPVSNKISAVEMYGEKGRGDTQWNEAYLDEKM